MAKLAPVERHFWIYPPSDVTDEDFYYIDIAQLLTKTNRRSSYRQGMQYVVENVEVFGRNSAAGIEMTIAALPNTWVVANSWVKAYSEWKSQQDKALLESGTMSTVARDRDFKIFMEAYHSNIGNFNNPASNPNPGLNLSPDGYLIGPTGDAQLAAISATASLEYEPTQVVVPNDGGVVGATAEYHLFMCGPQDNTAGTAKGMVVAYAQSRSRPFQTDPNVVDVAGPTERGLYEDMVDVGDNLEEVLENAHFNGNQPPYAIDDNTAVEFYGGGANQGSAGNMNVDILSVRSGSVIASDSSGPFLASCGLLRLNFAGDWYSSESYNGAVKITIAPGDYHGVMARRMQDVN